MTPDPVSDEHVVRAPHLRELSSRLENRVVPLRMGTTSFGRGPSNDVLLNAETIGRYIARFIRTSDQVLIEDAGHRTGVSVDGVLVPPNQRLRLRDGSIIQLGPFRFRFCDRDQSETDRKEEGGYDTDNRELGARHPHRYGTPVPPRSVQKFVATQIPHR